MYRDTTDYRHIIIRYVMPGYMYVYVYIDLNTLVTCHQLAAALVALGLQHFSTCNGPVTHGM